MTTTKAKEIKIEASAKRIRVFFNGETLADSGNTKLLFEEGYQPVIYFPTESVRPGALVKTDHHTTCPWKGEASYWSVKIGDMVEENAAWGYETPNEACAAIKDHVAFYWNKMQRWMEEDQALLGHARNPYVRIDTLPSSRRVTVTAKGQVLADSKRTVFVFETGHVTRYYIPRDDVRMELLRPSARKTVCPYKGAAGYLSAQLGEATIDDIAWFYDAPFAEVGAIKGHVCFYPERVDKIDVAPR